MSQENVEVARAALNAVGQADLARFLSLIDPDVTFNSLATEADQPLYRGHDGVERWFEAVTHTFEKFRTEPELIRDAGDRGVLAKLVLRGSARGMEVSQVVWLTATFREGKIASWTIHRDRSEALKAVGLSE